MNTTLTTDLTTLAEQINQEHLEAGAAISQSLQHARRAGELLIQAKAQVGHGEWGGWLEKHFHGSARTAQSYMRVASRFGELEQKTQRVADLPLREALALLAEPQEAEPQREEPAEFQSEPDAGSADPRGPSERELATLQHMLKIVAPRYLNLLNVIAKAYSKASPTPPAGYRTWQDFIDAEVILPRGMNFDRTPKISLEDWVDGLKALDEFTDALETAGKIKRAAGVAWPAHASRGGARQGAAGLGLLAHLETMGAVVRPS